MAPVQPIPAGFATVTPTLIFRDAKAAIAFYCQAFDATEQFRLVEPSGKIGHAEIQIGTSMLMLADEYPDFGALSPQTVGGSPVQLTIYTTEVERVLGQAIAAGALLLRPLATEFYGDRRAQVADPFGYTWTIATHVEDVSPAEMQRRFNVALGVE